MLVARQRTRKQHDREAAAKEVAHKEVGDIDVDADIKWGLEKAKTFGTIELEKKRLQLARDTEDSTVMLGDPSLLDPEGKNWLAVKKEINTQNGSTQ